MIDPITAAASINTGIATLEAAAKAGSTGFTFFEKFAPVWTGMKRDNAEYEIYMNRVELMKKYEEFRKKAGPVADRVVGMSFAKPFTEAAVLEDDSSLQDKWASLMLNAGNALSGVEPRTAYVSTLKELSALDVQILDVLYSDLGISGPMPTSRLPASITPRFAADGEYEVPQDVLASLANLQRLGCISFATNWGEEQLPEAVSRTLFGQLFVRACTVIEV